MKPREHASPEYSQGTQGQKTSAADLDAQLCAAVRDFENGDYVELPPGYARRCSETGESLWPDELSA
jgi:hypothetical protein